MAKARTTKKITICESCWDALVDEFGDEIDDMPKGAAAAYMKDEGSEIAYHRCERRDSGNKCDCGCNTARRARQAYKPCECGCS